MTKIKLCGLSTHSDIATANILKPEYIGFVFAPKSRRYITPAQAANLKQNLDTHIQAVGVFVNETPQMIAQLLNNHIIDIAQLHGDEDETYIQKLRALTNQKIIKAFRISKTSDLMAVHQNTADYILLDSGAGTGNVFDWKLIQDIKRPYFLAGGLQPDNVQTAIKQLHPYAVDVSSGIEIYGRKDKEKMEAFVAAVRKEDCI